MELRKCIVKGQESTGYFHRWHEKFWTIGPSAMVGGYTGGQMSAMTALVEYEDGSIHVVPAEWVVFCDR